MDRKTDAERIVDEIVRKIPKYIDGREAITWMKESGSRNWRQMEWIGFWFEHFFDVEIANDLSIKSGPRFGKTQIDIRSSYVWDLKAHPIANPTMILNDQEAFRSCIKVESSIGFIVLEGMTELDHSGLFKKWHDELKGSKSAYVLAGDQSGRQPRTRKTSFTPQRVLAFSFESLRQVDLASEAGWIKSFQKGMKNSNGNARRGKYMITDLGDIPEDQILVDRSI